MEEVPDLVPRTEIYRSDGYPVHANQHPVSALRRATGERAERWTARRVADDPGPPPLFLLRRADERIDRSPRPPNSWGSPRRLGPGLLERLGLPTGLLTTIVAPATPAGQLLPRRGGRGRARGDSGAAVASHDTASAVAAVPARGSFAYLSSGTWSLSGRSSPARSSTSRCSTRTSPTKSARRSLRLLKNITGLWLVEGCRRTWERAGRWPGYGAIGKAAREAPAFQASVDPNDP